jgi:hypothetical protein
MEHEPEPWQLTHPAHSLAIEGSEVVVRALGEQRFRIGHPNGSQEVEGFERARQLAHELARA